MRRNLKLDVVNIGINYVEEGGEGVGECESKRNEVKRTACFLLVAFEGNKEEFRCRSRFLQI